MEKLIKINERMQSIDPVRSTEAAFNTVPVQAKATELNIDQLQEGKGAQGQQLRTDFAVYPNVYALYTIKEKQAKGQPFDRVTLKDTGKFYSSLKVDPFPGHAFIKGDTEKPDGDMNDNIDVASALGIAPESEPEMIQEVIPQMLVDMRQQLRI